MTICQINALRAARNAGLYVPKETVEACIRYVKQSQNPDGGFRYMLQGGASAFPRSAAGVVALQSAGEYDTKEVRDGVAYLRQFMREIKLGSRYSHYFYGHYYAAQAMWIRGGDDWNDWYPGDPRRTAPAAESVGLLDRQHLQRIRHGHGPDHPPDAQQLPADLPAIESKGAVRDHALPRASGRCRIAAAPRVPARPPPLSASLSGQRDFEPPGRENLRRSRSPCFTGLTVDGKPSPGGSWRLSTDQGHARGSRTTHARICRFARW